MTAPQDVFRIALRSLVKGGYITPQHAARLAKTFQLDLGWLPGNEPLDVDIPSNIWPMVFLELLAVAEGTPYGVPRAKWQDARDYIAHLKIKDLLTIHERLQTKFEANNHRLATLLFAGGITLAAWRSGTWQSIKKLILHQAALGAGKQPDAAKLHEVLQRESEYFRKFAEAIFAGHVSDDTIRPVPRTAEQVASRADLYSGVPRGLFYELHEERGELGYGWVVQFRAKDDKHTCRPCRDAEGYYLANTGPYPGGVCKGRGRCRCVRVPVFDPDIYRRLVQDDEQLRRAA
jgi:hypothetical protein